MHRLLLDWAIRCLVLRHGGFVPAIRRRSLLEGWLPAHRFARKLNAWIELRRQ